MCRNPLFLGGLACLLLWVPPARAETSPSPLRLIPADADLLVEIKNVRQIHDLVLELDFVRELKKFPSTREFFNSTQARRFFQLLAYYEKEMGASYPDLLESLTGGGVALGVKFGTNPPSLLLAIQGKDEKRTKQFTDLALKILEQELQRQEAKRKPEKIVLGEIDATRIGPDIFLATVGSAVLISNRDSALQQGLDLARGRGGRSLADVESVQQAYRLLPPDLLAGFWVNMETVRKAPGAAAFYKTPRDAPLVVTIAPYLDVLGRAPFVCAGVARSPEGVVATVRAPSGREGMGAELPLHMPPNSEATGIRPLLAPRGVLYSDSHYFDLSRLWNDRDKLFKKEAVKVLEDLNNNTGKIPLTGLQLDKILTAAGPYHRAVVVNQPRVGYKIRPKTPIPAFAMVFEMRDPVAFSRSMEVALRGAAFLAGNQVGLRLAEQRYKGINLVGYRFPEDRPLLVDVNNIRYNFSPCYSAVGNQFFLSSTIELGRELIDLLQAEAKTKPQKIQSTSQVRIFSGGIAEILQLFEEQLVTQAILDQALPAKEARVQVKAFIELLRKQGVLNLDSTFEENETRLEIRIQGDKAVRLRTETTK